MPRAHSTAIGPFVVHSNAPIPPDAPWQRGLATLADEVAAVAGVPVPPGTTIDVYVLDDRQAFAHFLRMHHPGLPARRALMIVASGKPTIYAFRGPHLGVDLRHEGTHALLRASGCRPPAWLDEGLAECFEAGPRGLAPHPEHDGTPLPDADRRARLLSATQMESADYPEAWALVHAALCGDEQGRATLRVALRGGADRGRPGH